MLVGLVKKVPYPLPVWPSLAVSCSLLVLFELMLKGVFTREIMQIKRNHKSKESEETDRQAEPAVWKETRKAINGFESQYVFCLV